MKIFQKLTAFHLKIIGMLTMLIDHLGVFLFPDILWLRIIGRISFPIFAFLTAESMVHTRNKIRYFSVLFAMDVVLSMLGFLITHQYQANVFSVLALSSLAIYFLDQKKIYWKFGALLPLIYVIFSTFAFTPFKVQFGIYGFALCVGFHLVYRLVLYFFKSNTITEDFENGHPEKSDLFRMNLSLFSALFLLTYTLLCYYSSPILVEYFPNDNMNYYAQGSAILAVPFLLCYSGAKGYSSKVFRIGCYAFYPLHIAVLSIISSLV